MEKQRDLFEKKKIKGKSILHTSIVAREPICEEFKVELTEAGLEEKTIYGWSSIFFDYDLKFSFSYQELSITLQRNQERVVYKLKTQQQVNTWRNILRRYLNQKGFHEQFKPFKKIGKGNFASVYLVEKIEEKKQYAVKAFSKQQAYKEQKGKECLIKQIEVMRQLNHKNCMKLHEVFQSENSLYIIFELLEGGQLHQKVKAKYKFKPFEIYQIIRGILLGLREMHSHGIMHRDLKPENLLFREKNDWDCVIADFGLAEFSDEQEYLFVRCGTPGYVAPEVINIKDMSMKYRPICDIFSLGLIFYLLLTGKSAFPGKTYNEVLSQNRAGKVNLNCKQLNECSSQTLDLLERMLKKSPEARISAEQALAHPYFANEDFREDENVPQSHPNDLRFSNDCDSPLLTSANPKRRVDRSLKKDSCVQFKMGNQNVMTGKTEAIETIKGRISNSSNETCAKKPKISQFSAKKPN